jgi:chemotaxis protein methyltransferase CheR
MLFSEAELSPTTFAFLAGLVYDRSRIRLGTDKRSLVAGRLARHLEASGCPSFDAYCDLLRRPGADEEIGTLIDLISTNHTQFFREPAHFDILAHDLVRSRIRWRSCWPSSPADSRASRGRCMPPTSRAACSTAAASASMTPTR